MRIAHWIVQKHDTLVREGGIITLFLRYILVNVCIYIYIFNLPLWRVGLSMVLREQDPCVDFGFKGLIYITIRCVYIKSNVSLKLPPRDLSVSFPLCLSLSHSHTHTRARAQAYNNIYNIGFGLEWGLLTGDMGFCRNSAPGLCGGISVYQYIYAFMYLFIYSCVCVYLR